MNLISNNKFRIGVCWLLIVIACVSMMFVSNKPQQPVKPSITETNQICIKGAIPEDWMQVVTDKQFISEVVNWYDNITYEETTQQMDAMKTGEVYSLTFYKGRVEIASITINSDGIFVFELGTQPYKITSDFDFDELDSLIQGVISKPADATQDEA